MKPTTSLGLALFAVAYGTNVSTPFLVRYRERLDLTANATMTIFVVYVVGIMGTLLLAGPLSDRIGRRAVVLPMTAVGAVASLVLIPGRDDLTLLLLGRFLLGVVSGGVLGVGSAWLLELMGPGRELRAAVTSTVLTFAGFGLGPPVSALFDAFMPQPLVWPFVVHAALTVVAVAVAWSVPETRPPDRSVRVRPRLGVPVVGRRAFWRVVVPSALWVFCYPSTAFALFPVLLGESLDAGEVAVAAGSGVLTAWSGLFARPLVARIGAARVLPIGGAAGTIGYVLGWASFATGTWPLLLVGAVALGFAAGALTSGGLGMLGAMDAGANRGALTSTFYLLAYPGMAMPLLVTALSAISSRGTAMAVITVASGATAAVVAFAVRGGAADATTVPAGGRA